MGNCSAEGDFDNVSYEAYREWIWIDVSYLVLLRFIKTHISARHGGVRTYSF